ncbi:MAG: NAD(P)(+) transhydrogenase (Re/Si-specific) subunit beta [Syntrophales bacterium]|jgi:NAD(P) transhydrogenase subunit beta|nr:NAD(P)(+) transhydrogenase (Re/Si-specific) subunit beta [Syntrophales bacterium]MDY0043555.1 NAD(P)(+) transhydrogenase (Re/Si-specific) subunit beta [Syntrophales bacterium]
MDRILLINLVYIVAAVLFIIGLKMLTSQEHARRGNLISSAGMFLAVVITLIGGEIIAFHWIIIGVIAGGIIGGFAARFVKMTQMPEMVALFNGFGGIASLLVGWGAYHSGSERDLFTMTTTFLAVLIGGVTFTGSMTAWGKLSGAVTGKPVLFRGQMIVNGILFVIILLSGALFLMTPWADYSFFAVLVVCSLILGVMAVIPIGGADMPVVISLLNSYSGIAACAAGFAIGNNILIVSGALVGASGLILTNVMCKAMNRSLGNVLFGGFGAVKEVKKAAGGRGEVKPVSAQDAYYILEAAESVVFVPGYGMAVAQAQHALRELGEILEENGAEVRYAIHPVAGRMPGHMNVLLAEADVPYEKLIEMDEINRSIASVDVCVVVGANDVVNPAAREDRNSSIYGMPIINADAAHTVIVLKRSLSPGFAGIDNPLFIKPNTRMLFGDAKSSIETLTAEFKQT